MASRKQRKKRAKIKEHLGPIAPGGARGRRRERPTPVQAIESKQCKSRRAARRAFPTRFSQLLAKSFKDERAGQHLVSRVVASRLKSTRN